MNITKHLLSNQLLSFLKSETTGDLKSLCSQLVSSVLSDGAPAGGPCLSCVNVVWVEQSLPLQPSFKQLMTADFKATFCCSSFRQRGTPFLYVSILNPCAMLLLVFYLSWLING